MKKISSHLLETSRVAEESVARSYSVFRWAVAFIVFVVLLIAALEGWRLAQDYENAFATASDSATNLTRAAAQQAEDTFRQVDSLLVGVRGWIEDEGLDTIKPIRIHRALAAQVTLMPQLHSMTVIDAQGRWRASDLPSMPIGVDVRDREYFVYHQTHQDRDLHIGPVITSRTTGDRIIPLSRRFNAPDGSFGGVLLSAIKVNYFAQYYSDFKVGPKGVFVLALRTGEVLVRSPAITGLEGKSLASGEVFQHRLPYGSEGLIRMTSVVDDQQRIFGYKALLDFALVMEAGISTESIVSGWQRDLIKSAMVALVMLLGIGAFSLYFLQQLRSKISMAEVLQVAHSALQEIALYDDLTKLANRRQLDRRLAEELILARESGAPLSLIMLDIDFFKRFNDQYGHVDGDECLRKVASAVLGALRRAGDLAVRYGGEEMTVMLPDTDASSAGETVERILGAIRGLNIAHAQSPFERVTASAGVFVSTWATADLTPAKMIREADAQLYLAKTAGRDRWRMVAVNDNQRSVKQPGSSGPCRGDHSP